MLKLLKEPTLLNNFKYYFINYDYFISEITAHIEGAKYYFPKAKAPPIEKIS